MNTLQVDVCAVGGDKVCHALWRSGPGRAMEALEAAGTAAQTDAFILLGINDVMGGGERVVEDVVGGVCALAGELKAGLKRGTTRIHILEVPILPMYDLPGNEGMREDAENINAALKSLREPIQFEKMA